MGEALKRVVVAITEAREKNKQIKQHELNLSRGLSRLMARYLAERHGLAGKIGFKFPKAGPV